MATFTSAGALAGLEAVGVSLLQYPASELESGASQVFLRVRRAAEAELVPLTGPTGARRVTLDNVGAVSTGSHLGISATLWWDEAPDAFAWRWRVINKGSTDCQVDLCWCLDAGLASAADIARNQYYVSQYLDVSPFAWRDGIGLGVRQNMPGAANPWLGLVSSAPASQWATDAAQLSDPALAGRIWPRGDLPNQRLQAEHTCAALRTTPRTLAPGDEAEGAFLGFAVADHPDATSDDDAPRVAALLDAAIWRRTEPPSVKPTETAPRSLFSFSPDFPADALTDDDVAELVGPLTGVETAGGELLSGFATTSQVVTPAKERLVMRPHGQVLHAGVGPLFDERGTAVTVWMRGGFATQLTRGHSCADPQLGLRQSWLGLVHAGGLRLAAQHEGEWRLLGLPSLWRLDQHGATWWYRGAGQKIEVSLLVQPEGRCELSVTTDEPLLLIADAGPRLRFGGVDLGDDAPLFSDGIARHTGQRCALIGSGCYTLQVGEPVAQPAAHDWRLPQLEADDETTSDVSRMLGWLAHDAEVHYQSPRGLEQFIGGAWGTRDVCQGPVGLLVASGEHEALRAVLLRTFAAQQANGDWPQWFDYLPGHDATAPDSHGDVVYWPLLALGEYLEMTGDASVLTEPVAWADSPATSSLREHVQAALAHTRRHRLFDGRLPAYGHGDWNDSMQPASPALAAELCSTWTAVLETQALVTLARGLRAWDAAWASTLMAQSEATREALLDVALVGGELAGYARQVGTNPELLVHPTDELTGLHHGLLQQIHAISAEVLAAADAEHHRVLIEEHLNGPTGAYLFDHPVAYHGGPVELFRRAEAATFWGREIGLMYTHSHLRWVEALCVLGRGDDAWRELLKAIPIGLADRVPSARRRQTTCYYSSSDARFTDRYHAERDAEALFSGAVGFEGGWRVYSSGPGIMLRLVAERFLGVRVRADHVELDPVLPSGWGEVTASVPLPRGEVKLRLLPNDSPPRLGDTPLEAIESHNSYRRAGWNVPREAIERAAASGSEVLLGHRVR